MLQPPTSSAPAPLVRTELAQEGFLALVAAALGGREGRRLDAFAEAEHALLSPLGGARGRATVVHPSCGFVGEVVVGTERVVTLPAGVARAQARRWPFAPRPSSQVGTARRTGASLQERGWTCFSGRTLHGQAAACYTCYMPTEHAKEWRAGHNLQRGVPAGWYCVAILNELPPRSSVTRPYFGGQVFIHRTGRAITATATTLEGELPVRLALGAVWVWHPGQRGGPRAPRYELPLARLEGGGLQIVPSKAIMVRAPFERAFCDYFDHWHTRTIHGLPVRDAGSWWEGDRCGVHWNVTSTLLERQSGVLARLSIESRSDATLFGLSLAIDEFKVSRLHVVNVQANTPVADDCFEMRTFAGVHAIARQGWATRLAAGQFLKKIVAEVERDRSYWAECERKTFPRDAESNAEMSRFAEWAAALA